MGMSLGRGKRRAMADINVTPLVDVMLVLLVIFMITAPVLKEGFQVEVPLASETQSINVQDARSVIVTSDGAVLHNLATAADDRYEKLSLLVDDLRTWRTDRLAAATSGEPVVLIVGDKATPYERIIQVWNAVRSAGITQVGFQLDPSGVVPAATP